MATVVIKATAGVDYTLASGKVISLKGNSVLNKVDDLDLKELLANERFSKKVDLGYIVTGVVDNEKTTEDLQQTISDTQKKKQQGNETKNNVKLETQTI